MIGIDWERLGLLSQVSITMLFRGEWARSSEVVRRAGVDPGTICLQVIQLITMG